VEGACCSYLDEHLSVLLDRLVRLLSLLLLLRLDGNVEVDLELLVLEAVVEGVGRAGLGLVLWRSSEDLGLEHDAERRVEGLTRERGCGGDVIVADRVVVVEQQHDGHLVRGDLEGVRHLVHLDVVGADLALAQVPEPGELATTMLLAVEVGEALVGPNESRRWRERGGWGLERPEAGTQNLPVGVNSTLAAKAVLQVFIVVPVKVLRCLHVLEHTLELVGVLKARSVLELGDHGGLCVARCRSAVDKTLGKHLRVELLEHILVLNVLEESHDLVEELLHVVLLAALLRALEHVVGVLREQLGRARRGLRADLVAVDVLATGVVEGADEL